MKILYLVIILIIICVGYFIYKKFKKKQIQPIINNKLPLRNYDTIIEGATKFNTDKAQLYVLDDFLNKDECDLLVKIIKENLVPSRTTTGKSYVRTSYTSHMNDPTYKDFIDYIEYKISQKMQIPIEYTEKMQGQHYSVGQEFKLHTDWFNPNLPEAINLKKQGNRTWTFMIYLNDVEEGGDTWFKNIDHKFKPKMGQALIWNNLLDDGSLNYNTFHAGLPIIKGEKVIVTKWFREYSL